MLLMLKSFVGSYNETGLQSLQTEDDHRCRKPLAGGIVSFWAILETEVVPQIERALRFGDRRTALKILADSAKDAGSILS